MTTQDIAVVEDKVDEMGFFEIDLNGWNYKDFKAFRKAAAEDNDEVFMPLMAKVVKAWPYEGKPSQATIENLGLEKLGVLLNAVMQAIAHTFRSR